MWYYINLYSPAIVVASKTSIGDFVTPGLSFRKPFPIFQAGKNHNFPLVA